MSWNPRRFAAVVNRDITTDATFIWLSADAIHRLRSAADHPTSELSAVPPGVIAIGLASPLVVGTDLVSILLVGGTEATAVALRETDALGRQHHFPPMPPLAGRHNVIIRTERRCGTPTHLGTVALDGAAPVASVEFAQWSCNLQSVVWDTPAGQQYLAARIPPGRGLIPLDAHREIAQLVRAAWTLYSTPMEREVTATVLTPQVVPVGKRRKSRDLDISVIDIRPPSGVRYSHSGREIEHDHRWPVRGHWRNQPFGPGRSQRRRIWIDAQVRGPEDKPLIDRQKVYRIAG